jgi:hypothetical protein
MPHENKDQHWLEQWLAADPASAPWAGLAAELVKRLPRLDAEDQVKAIERLAALAAEPAAAELLRTADERVELSLPALVALLRARAGAGGPGGDLAAELDRWRRKCEDEDAEFGADEFFALPEPARRAVTEHLALWLRAELLGRLKDAAPDKAAAKALAKALHRAKSAGASVAAPDGSRYVLADRDESADEAYMSPPDSLGTCILYLYRTIFGKNTFMVIIANEFEGVTHFDAFHLNRARLERVLESARRGPRTVLAKVDAAFARRWLRKMEAAGIKRGIKPNEDYLSKRRSLGVVDEPEAVHPVWSRLDAEALRAERGLVFRSGELVRHRVFEDWRLESLDGGLLLAKLAELKSSPIELTPAQQREREDDLLREEAARVIADAGREAWGERLLLCAYLLSLIGAEDEAKMAAAVALALEPAGDPPPAFFLALLRRTLAADHPEGEQPPADPDPGGLIVT